MLYKYECQHLWNSVWVLVMKILVSECVSVFYVVQVGDNFLNIHKSRCNWELWGVFEAESRWLREDKQEKSLMTKPGLTWNTLLTCISVLENKISQIEFQEKFYEVILETQKLKLRKWFHFSNVEAKEQIFICWQWCPFRNIKIPICLDTENLKSGDIY